MKQIRSNHPDPAKAIVLKPGQRRWRRQSRSAADQTSGHWQPHQSNVALDGWGVALRALREQGHAYE